MSTIIMGKYINKCENYEACFAFFRAPIFKINLPKANGKVFKFTPSVEI